MPRLNSVVQRNKYVLRRRPVSETSNSVNSDAVSSNSVNSDAGSSSVLQNMSDTDSISNIKSVYTSCFNSDCSSDEHEEHNYSFKKDISALKSFDMRPVFKDASNLNQYTNLVDKNTVDLEGKKINMGLNKNSNPPSTNTRSRSNSSLIRNCTSKYDCSEIMNTFKLSKNKNLSKNAINAKLNRIKKKQHIMALENEITSLRKENTTLQSCIGCNSEMISSLKNEVKYLRSIIANSSELGTILRNVCRNTNLEVVSPFKRTSLIKSMDSQEVEHNDNINTLSGMDADNFISEMDDILKNKSLSTEESDEFMLWDKSPLEVEDFSNFDFNNDVGVCLHVSNKKVSLEFCASCNQNSTNCKPSSELNEHNHIL